MLSTGGALGIWREEKIVTEVGWEDLGIVQDGEGMDATKDEVLEGLCSCRAGVDEEDFG